MSEQEWRAAGLYDPDAPDAAQRLELLRWIDGHGVTLAEMIEADADCQLGSVVGDLRLRRTPTLSIADVAARTGLSVEQVTDVRRATGFLPAEPETPVYTEAELEMFELFAVAATLFSGDELVHFVRVMAGSLRRIAEAATEMFLRDVEAPLQLGDRSELAVAQASLAGIELVDVVTRVFEPMFRAHLQITNAATRRARMGQDDYSTLTLAVGFVDLSGFTARSGELSPDELLQLVVAFESAAVDLVSEHGGRLIKVIGDEVMFSTIDADTACDIAVGLLDRAATWGVGARGGVARGPVVTSGGDVYGPTVNLASRIVDAAVPGEVLVNEAVTRAAPQLRFEAAGRRQLKGFAEPVRLWSLEPVSR